MKKTLFATLFVFALSVALSLSANAQLTYTEGKLTMDTTPESGYKITLGTNGMYMKLPSQSNFFQIDIAPTNTRLAGHNDQIAFYNSKTNTFNSISVQNVFYHSDARSKTNIQNFGGGLGIVLRLRPVTYDFIGSEKTTGTGQEIGLLAQEVESILPGAVMTDGNGTKMINYNALIPVLIDAVKSLQAEVAALKEGR